jgi:outer membrane protein assembly factor BamB
LDCWSFSEEATLWNMIFEGKSSPNLCFDNNKLFIASGDGHLYCVNPKTKEIIWDLENEAFKDEEYKFLSVFNNKLYCLFPSSGEIVCIDIEKGKQLWSVKGEFQSNMAVNENGLLVMSKYCDSTLLNMFSHEDGKTLWAQSFKGVLDTAMLPTRVMLAGKKAYASFKNQMFCIDATNGKTIGTAYSQTEIYDFIVCQGCVVISNGKFFIAYKGFEPGCISFDNNTCNFGQLGSSQATKKVKLINCSGEDLNVKATSSDSFLSVEPSSFVLEKDKDFEVSVSIDAAKIKTKGMQKSIVAFSSGIKTVELEVKYFIPDKQSESSTCDWSSQSKTNEKNIVLDKDCSLRSTNLSAKWNFSITKKDKDTHDSEMTPLIVNGKAYAMMDKNLVCLDARTGKLLWKKETGINQTLAFEHFDNKIFIGAHMKDCVYVLCFSAVDGTKIWEKEANLTTMAVSNGKIVCLNTDQIICYDASDCTKIWEKPLNADVFDPVSWPAISNNMIVIILGKLQEAEGNYTMSCFDLNTGKIHWEKTIKILRNEIDEFVFSTIKPVNIYKNGIWLQNVVDETLYLSSFDLFSGQQIKKLPIQNAYISESLAITDDVVYGISGKDYVCANSKTDGKLLWEIKPVRYEYSDGLMGKGSRFSKPIISSNSLEQPSDIMVSEINGKRYVFCCINVWHMRLYDSNMFCIDDSGKLIWQLEMESPYSPKLSPIVDGKMYVLKNGTELTCYDSFAPSKHKMVFTKYNQFVRRDDFNYVMDVLPKIDKGVTYIPAKYLAEPLDGTVSWDSTTKMVTCKIGENSVSVFIGKQEAIVNGKKVTIDKKMGTPMVDKGRTLVPLRFIMSAFGFAVNFDAKTGFINIDALLKK